MTGPKIILLVLIAALVLPAAASGRELPAFVSTDWLERHLDVPGLLVIDVRSGAEYGKGHVPGAVNVPVDSWAGNRDGLFRELPDEGDLGRLMGSIGARAESSIVVVGAGGSDFERADAIRVAWTVLVAGVPKVSVLDGGFSRWVRERKPESVAPTPLGAGRYRARMDGTALASKRHVLERGGEAVLVDNRTPDLYFGMTTEPWARRAGHIRGARSLPAPWAFGPDGLLRNRDELESMARGVIGEDRGREIITYCGVGVYASVWSYILTEVLGYRKVKVYDGSMQEWIRDPAGPVDIHRWR